MRKPWSYCHLLFNLSTHDFHYFGKQFSYQFRALLCFAFKKLAKKINFVFFISYEAAPKYADGDTVGTELA